MIQVVSTRRWNAFLADSSEARMAFMKEIRAHCVRIYGVEPSLDCGGPSGEDVDSPAEAIYKALLHGHRFLDVTDVQERKEMTCCATRAGLTVFEVSKGMVAILAEPMR